MTYTYVYILLHTHTHTADSGCLEEGKDLKKGPHIRGYLGTVQDSRHCPAYARDCAVVETVNPKPSKPCDE